MSSLEKAINPGKEMLSLIGLCRVPKLVHTGRIPKGSVLSIESHLTALHAKRLPLLFLPSCTLLDSVLPIRNVS
jgi:hypothetical protein